MLAFEEEAETVGNELTVTTIGLLLAELGDAQLSLEVIVQVTLAKLLILLLVYVFEFVPTVVLPIFQT